MIQQTDIALHRVLISDLVRRRFTLVPILLYCFDLKISFFIQIAHFIPNYWLVLGIVIVIKLQKAILWQSFVSGNLSLRQSIVYVLSEELPELVLVGIFSSIQSQALSRVKITLRCCLVIDSAPIMSSSSMLLMEWPLKSRCKQFLGFGIEFLRFSVCWSNNLLLLAA